MRSIAAIPKLAEILLRGTEAGCTLEKLYLYKGYIDYKYYAD